MISSGQRASFDDPLGRRIQLIGRQALIPPVAGQCFGGVATQMAQPFRPDVSDASSTGPRWILFPLIAWAEFEIRVNEEPTDTGVVGAIRLVQDEANTLRLTLYPRVVDVDGQSRASPIQAAEDLGVDRMVHRVEKCRLPPGARGYGAGRTRRHAT